MLLKYPKCNGLSHQYPCPVCKGTGKKKWFEDGIIGLFSNILFGRAECSCCEGGKKTFYWQQTNEEE